MRDPILTINDEGMRRRLARRGCCGMLALAAGALLLFFGCAASFTLIGAFVFEQQRPIPGDAARFDPVAQFDAIQDYAGRDYQLYALEATYVRSDGTLDLYADYTPRVNYRFLKVLDSGASSAPLGAGGSRTGRSWEVVEVDVERPFRVISLSSGRGGVSLSLRLGLDRDVFPPQGAEPGEVVSPPACPLRQLWDVARARDTPADAVAIITYDSSGYFFRIAGTGFAFYFSSACELISQR